MPEIEIPIYYLVSRSVYNDPAERTEQYFQHLNAPIEKHQVCFENSAYDLFVDEPQKLVKQTLSILENTQ